MLRKCKKINIEKKVLLELQGIRLPIKYHKVALLSRGRKWGRDINSGIQYRSIQYMNHTIHPKINTITNV